MSTDFGLRTLEDDGRGVPAFGKLRERRGLLGADGALGADGEMNPATAARALPGETGVVPPGADQQIVGRLAVVFRFEVDGLHSLPTLRVRARRVRIDDVRGHVASLTALPVDLVHLVRVPGAPGGFPALRGLRGPCGPFHWRL